MEFNVFVSPIICMLVGFFVASWPKVNAKPGAAVHFTEKGLNYATQSILDSATKWILDTEHKHITGECFIFNYLLSDVSIQGLKTVESNVVIEQGSELSWQISNVDFNLTSDIELKVRSYKFMDAELHISVTNTNLYLPMKFGTNGKGQPTLQSTCQFNDTGDWSIQFKGDHWSVCVLNWLVKALKGTIVGNIENKICLAVSTSLNTAARKSFSTYRNILKVGPQFSANYSLSDSASYNKNSVLVPLVGEVFWTKGRTASSLKVPDLPPLTQNDKMLYFTLTDYVFNSLAFAAFHQELLDKTVTHKDLPAEYSYYLNTTCPGNSCLGKLIAQTSSRFPNSVAELQIKSSERPQMVISPGSVGVSFNANIQFYVNTPQKKHIYMFSIKTRLDTLLHILPNEIATSGRVTAVINGTSLSVGILDSSIGAINLSLLNTLMNTIVNIYIAPQLNRLGASGIPLPNLGKNIKCKGQPKLYIVKNGIIVGADVTYKKDTTGHLFYQKADKQNSFQVVLNQNKKNPVIL